MKKNKKKSLRRMSMLLILTMLLSLVSAMGTVSFAIDDIPSIKEFSETEVNNVKVYSQFKTINYNESISKNEVPSEISDFLQGWYVNSIDVSCSTEIKEGSDLVTTSKNVVTFNNTGKVVVEVTENYTADVENTMWSGKTIHDKVTRTYVFNVTAAVVDSVSATVTAPQVGVKPSTKAISGDDDKYTVTVQKWNISDTNTTMGSGETFAAGKTYAVHLIFTPKQGYVLKAYAPATINSKSANSATNDGSGSRHYYLKFTMPAASNVASTLEITDLTAPAHGAAADYNASVTNKGFTVSSVSYERGDGQELVNYKGMAGDAIEIVVGVKASNGYVFGYASDATWNGINCFGAKDGADNERLFYFDYIVPAAEIAVPATEITDVFAKVTAPVIGAKPAATAASGDSSEYSVAAVSWEPSDSVFTTGKEYSVLLALETKDGFKFAATPTVAINGELATVVSGGGSEEMKIRYTFPAMVDGAPVITAQPKDVDAVVGDSVTFSVKAEGKDMHYKWWYVDAGAPFSFDEDSPSITIKTEDQGWNGFNFWCVVSNSEGSVSSEKAHLTVSKELEAPIFIDVSTNKWYYTNVMDAFKMGLINGKTENNYKPDDNMTFAEAIKLAVCMNIVYNGGNPKEDISIGTDVWYSTYVDYAKKHNIPAQYSNYDATITREEYIHIFFAALPTEEYSEVNRVGDSQLPDVSMGDKYGEEILTFYRAGILTGNDVKGTFSPNSNIKRSEVAAILSRMMDDTARMIFTLA